MRVLVTGAGGFVGSWLRRELVSKGHEVVPLPPGVDVRDSEAVIASIRSARPAAIAHLAAISYAPDAATDQGAAYAVAVGGTANVFEAARLLEQPPVLLVAGSSEVYGLPREVDLPLSEASPLRAQSPYGLSKIAQESIAVAYSTRYSLPVVVARSFNHVGPGQRRDFMVPALAERVAAFVSGSTEHIPVGNVDVKRDLTDVRDVVRAYRLLLEDLADERLGTHGLVVNVCSGESATIRWVAEELCRMAGIEPRLEVDPSLVRTADAPDIRGDYSLLAALTGWRPQISLVDSLRDIWAMQTITQGERLARNPPM